MSVSSSDRKTVLIIGASSGIGKCCAERLTASGWRVFGASRSAPPAEAYETLRIDIEDDDSVRDGVALILQKSGRIDAVVNSGGVSTRGSVEDVPMAEARQIMETNLFGVLRVCQATLPAIRASKGVIVNISSFGGSIGTQFGGHYAASKFAVRGLTESLRRELAPLGVRVVDVSPGLFKTRMTENVVISEGTLHGAFAGDFAKFLKGKDKFMKNMSTPEPVAVLIEKILTSDHPKGYYFVGPFFQRIVLVLKKILPQRAFDALIARALG